MKYVVVLCACAHFLMVDLLAECVVKKREVKQSASQIKNDIGQDLEAMHGQCTGDVRLLMDVVDQIKQMGCDLAAQEGIFATSDKEALQKMKKKLEELLKTLQNLEQELSDFLL